MTPAWGHFLWRDRYRCVLEGFAKAKRGSPNFRYSQNKNTTFYRSYFYSGGGGEIRTPATGLPILTI